MKNLKTFVEFVNENRYSTGLAQWTLEDQMANGTTKEEGALIEKYLGAKKHLISQVNTEGVGADSDDLDKLIEWLRDNVNADKELGKLKGGFSLISYSYDKDLNVIEASEPGITAWYYLTKDESKFK